MLICRFKIYFVKRIKNVVTSMNFILLVVFSSCTLVFEMKVFLEFIFHVRTELYTLFTFIHAKQSRCICNKKSVFLGCSASK